MANVLRPWLAILALSGCHILGGTDDLFIVDGEPAVGGGGGATSTTTSTTTASTSTGGRGGGSTSSGEFQCTDATQCPVPDDPCMSPKCTLGDCEFIPSPANLSCDEGYCDGKGLCVECTELAHCTGQLCVEGQCVDGSCQDGELTGDETDVDCGGECSPCENNATCMAPSDCKSGICAATICVACTAQSDCAGTHYCDLGKSGHCLAKKNAFSGCKNDYECKSNSCDNWFDYCHL